MLSGPAFNCSVGWRHHSHRGKATNAPSWGHGPSHPAEISTVSFGTKGTSAAGAGQQRVPAGSGVCGERLAQGGPAPPWGETSSPLPQSWGCSGPPSAATALAAPPPPPCSSQPGPCSRDTRPRSLCTVPALAKLPAGSTGAAVPLLWAHAWGSPALLGTGSGLSTEHGAGQVPGAEPAPCPAASPPQGTFCPWRVQAGWGPPGLCVSAPARPGRSHQAGSCGSLDAGGVGVSALPPEEGSRGTAQSYAGPARLRCRALG